jgi:hypothetical protein
VLNSSVFAGCIHRLKDQEQRPLVLGVELILQFGEARDSCYQRFLRSGFVFLSELKGVIRIDIFQAKVLAFGDAKRFDDFSGCSDDFFCFYKFSCASSFAILR